MRVKSTRIPYTYGEIAMMAVKVVVVVAMTVVVLWWKERGF